MSNVRLLSGLNPEAPDQVLVDMLEDMLSEAKSGSLRSVAIVGVRGTGEITTAYHNGANYFTLLGGVTLIQTRMALVAVQDGE